MSETTNLPYKEKIKIKKVRREGVKEVAAGFEKCLGLGAR